MKQPTATSPISFDVAVARLPKNGLPVTIEATGRQRAALADIHDVLNVERFRADLLVTGWKRNGVKIEGRVRADIVQACVVTLDPLPATIDVEIDAVYLPEISKFGREGFGSGGEILLDADGPDSPETFAGDRIDVGALAEEHFGLAIDPYPRRKGASLDVLTGDTPPDQADENPIRKLGSLFPKA